MKFDNVQPITKETRRVELPLGAAVVGFTVSYCDPRSAEYLRVKSKYSKPYRKLIEVEALPPERDREIVINTFVECCLTGWDGITSNGNPVEYSVEAARDLLTQSPTTFYSLTEEAQELGNFKPTEGDAGN